MKKDDTLTRSRKRKARAALQAGRLEEACGICEQLVGARPADTDTLVLLGTVYRRLGRYPQAERVCRQALTLNPQLAQGHHVLGAVLQCQGNTAGAVDCYRTALALDSKLLDAHYLLANALRELGELDQAITHYRAVLARDPAHVPALNNLGGTLLSQHRLEEAAEHLNEANRLQPHAAPVLAQTARVLQLQGRTEEAMARFREALAADPQAVDCMASLADLLERSNRLEEAARLVERGLAVAPTDPMLQLCAARQARRAGRHQDAVAIAERALAANPAGTAHGEIHMLLGLLYDRLDDTRRAFAHFTQGNTLLAAARADHEDRYLQRVNRLRAEFRATLPLLADQHPAQDDDATPSPAFLVGFPRSGTTLLEQILDSHPQLQALDERPTVNVMSGLYDAIVAERPAAASALTGAEIVQLRKAYFQEAGKYVRPDAGKTTLLDKQPLNLDSACLIWRVFPQAKFILALRHPCDACLSCFMQSFSLNLATATFTQLDSTAVTYAGVMSLWNEYSAGLPLRYHPLRYEDLVEDMEGEARRLLQFLDIQWSPAVLSHVEHAKGRGAINTPSYHQVTQPIYKTAKYRWKRYAQEMEPVMATLRPFIEQFGYAE